MRRHKRDNLAGKQLVLSRGWEYYPSIKWLIEGTLQAQVVWERASLEEFDPQKVQDEVSMRRCNLARLSKWLSFLKLYGVSCS